MWSVGDKCMAPFSEDDKYYRATIQSITTDCQGNKRVTVKFSGYTSDENETVDVTRLKVRTVRKQHRSGSATSSSTSVSSYSDGASNTSFTSPLRYMPEQDRLRDKFSDLLDTVSSGSISLQKSPSESQPSVKTAQKRKYAVAIGGNIKEPSLAYTPSRTSSKSLSVQSSPVPSVPTQQSCEAASLDINEGFSSEELERPYFPHSSHVGPKVPLLLSEPDTEPVVQVPATINRYLRDYQREGVKFLYRHFIKNEGAILGDDMGLGKTVQVLAFLCAVLGKTGTKEDCQRRLPEFLQKKLKSTRAQSTDVYLIICPNAVLYNWLDEFETWTYCTTGKFHGKKDRSETLLKAMRGKLDVVLTTYETYRLYLDELHKVKWAAVFVDEVHKIKAPDSLITQALKEVNTLRRYGLTGTALQNEMTELWCVLDWAKPGCLGPLKQFKTEFASVITKGQTFDASKRELAEGRQTSLRFSRLRSKWLLRRTKALIADQLPTKEEKVVFCKLTDLQLSVYKALLDSDDLQQLVLRQYEICDCGSLRKRGKCCYKENDHGILVKALTFSFMTLLTKVSNHVALLMPETKMSDLQRLTVQTYCDIAFAKHPQFVQLSKEARFCTLSDPKYCGKMQVLEKLLHVFKKESSKVLIFSHYTQLLDIFEMYLKTTEYVYRRLDGKTPAQDRQKYVHEFNRDKDIFLFLISTKAGGQGLNLTGANVVIIYDPTWNPTYDLQAQDRAYRIGQHRDVRVFRLISAGSIEENMYLRQIYKQQIASVAIESENAKRYFTGVAGSKSGELFGLRNMFELRSGDGVLTKDLIEREYKTIKGVTMAKYIPSVAGQADQNDKQKQANSVSQGDEEREEGNHGNSDEDDEPPDASDGDGDYDDTHGIASQLDIISDESEVDEPDVKKGQFNEDDDTDACLEDGSNDDTENHHIEKKNGVKRRGKAIVHKDGRIESRVKGRKAEQFASPNIRSDHRQGLERRDESDGKHCVDSGKEAKTTTVTKRKNSDIEAVDNVLKECGVSYVHSNTRLVGGSKVEDHVSNAAIRDVFELDQHSQQPANYNVPTLEESIDSQNSDSPKEKKQSPSSVYHSHDLPSSQSKPLSFKVNSTTILMGQTPRGIRRRHFKELAKAKGFSSTADLAKHILTASLEDQVAMLKEYYPDKHPGLELNKYFELSEEAEPEPKPPHRTTRTAKQSQKKESVRSVASGRRTASGRKATNSVRRTKMKPSRQRPQPKGFHFESASESEDDEEPPGERTKHSKTAVKCLQSVKEESLSPSSDVEAMDTHESATSEEEMDTKNGKFTNLRGQENNLSKSRRDFNKRDPKPVTESSDKGKERGKKNASHESKKESSSALQTSSSNQEQNLSFLDDIFLTSSASKKIRKPPPKKKQLPRKQEQQHMDTLWEDEQDCSQKDSQDIDECGVESRSKLWRRNSKYGQKQEKIDAALDAAMEEESQSVFHKYSSSFVANKNYKRKVYRFDAEKDDFFSESLSSG